MGVVWDDLTNMKTRPNNLQPQVPSPREQWLRRIEMRTELIAQINQRTIIFRVNAEQKLGLGHVHFDFVEFVDIVIGRPDDAGLARKNQCRGRLAWICKEDAGWVYTLV